MKYHLLLELRVGRCCHYLVWIKALVLRYHTLMALVRLASSKRAREKLLLDILVLLWEEPLWYDLRLILSKISLLLGRWLLWMIESIYWCRMLILREHWSLRKSLTLTTNCSSLLNNWWLRSLYRRLHLIYFHSMRHIRGRKHRCRSSSLLVSTKEQICRFLCWPATKSFSASSLQGAAHLHILSISGGWNLILRRLLCQDATYDTCNSVTCRDSL